MDKTGLKILQVLRENGRLTNAELSERIALPPSPYLHHLKQFEDTGVTHKCAVLLSPVAARLDLQAFIRVSISEVEVARGGLSATIQMQSEVLDCFAPIGGTDYLLHAFLTDMNAFSHFVLDTLLPREGVQDAQSGFVLKEVKSTTALPLTHLQRDQGLLL